MRLVIDFLYSCEAANSSRLSAELFFQGVIWCGDGAISRNEVITGLRDACISPREKVSCEWDIAEGPEGVIFWCDHGQRLRLVTYILDGLTSTCGH